jgi:prepilin-type processing-associated H-X9-DG protein
LPATSNYIGVMGLFDNAGTSYNDGFFPGGNCIRIRDIIDGTSSTMAVGERDKKCYSGIWFGVRSPMDGNSNDYLKGPYQVLGRVSVKQNDTNGSLVGGTTGTPPYNCSLGFGSSHPGGAQYVFGDGSVHFISDGIPWLDPKNITPTLNLQMPNGPLPGGVAQALAGTNQTPAPTTPPGLYELLGIVDGGQPKSGGW